jgi:hypothetical protein
VYGRYYLVAIILVHQTSMGLDHIVTNTSYNERSGEFLFFLCYNDSFSREQNIQTFCLYKFPYFARLHRISIHIKKNVCLSVCLSVRYTFPHRATDFDETFQEPSSHPGGGRRLLFFEKKSTLRMLQAIYETDQ